MREQAAARVGLAIVRAVVEDGPHPVIRVLQMGDLFRDEQVVGITSSPDEAAGMIRDWLVSVIRGQPGAAP
jgi:hypothetical protein